jgi:hypothetical protein
VAVHDAQLADLTEEVQALYSCDNHSQQGVGGLLCALQHFRQVVRPACVGVLLLRSLPTTRAVLPGVTRSSALAWPWHVCCAVVEWRRWLQRWLPGGVYLRRQCSKPMLVAPLATTLLLLGLLAHCLIVATTSL